MADTGLGKSGTVTCIEGYVFHDVDSRYREEHNLTGGYCTHLHVPCEVLIIDLVLREDTFGPLLPRVMVYGEHAGRAPN